MIKGFWVRTKFSMEWTIEYLGVKTNTQRCKQKGKYTVLRRRQLLK